MTTLFEQTINEHLTVIQALSGQASIFERIAEQMCHAIYKAGKIIWCGSGGSAADAQHLVAEVRLPPAEPGASFCEPLEAA